MTSCLTVAYSELTRVLPWSIRALGYKFGVADRAAFLVATAASMKPEVLQSVVTAEHRPEAESERRWIDGVLSINARGISWLEVGPMSMDYLGARAARGNVASCLITSATEPDLIPAVLRIGANYGLISLAIQSSGTSFAWRLLRPTGSRDDGPALFAGRNEEHLNSFFECEDVLKHVSLGPLRAGDVLLVSWKPRFNIEDSLKAGFDGGVIFPDECVKRALAQGIPIKQDVLKALYELEMITWAPTSERSRAQAGFQQAAGSSA